MKVSKRVCLFDKIIFNQLKFAQINQENSVRILNKLHLEITVLRIFQEIQLVKGVNKESYRIIPVIVWSSINKMHVSNLLIKSLNRKKKLKKPIISLRLLKEITRKTVIILNSLIEIKKEPHFNNSSTHNYLLEIELHQHHHTSLKQTTLIVTNCLFKAKLMQEANKQKYQWNQKTFHQNNLLWIIDFCERSLELGNNPKNN